MKERGNCCLQRGLARNRTPGLEEGLGFAVQGREELQGENSHQRDLFSANTCKGRGQDLKQSTVLTKGQRERTSA